MRGDVRPRPPREPVASNSLRPHLLLNAAHPRERGQVTVNLSLFSVPHQQGAFFKFFLFSVFYSCRLHFTRTSLTQVVGTSSLIRRENSPHPSRPPGSADILGVIFPPARCVCVSSLYIFYPSGRVLVCVCGVSGGCVCVCVCFTGGFAEAFTHASVMEDRCGDQKRAEGGGRSIHQFGA